MIPRPPDYESDALTSWATSPSVVHPQRLELWTHWLRVSCSTNWATDAYSLYISITNFYPSICQRTFIRQSLVSGRRWIRTTEVERQQIYSLPHLATLVTTLYYAHHYTPALPCSLALRRASCRIRTNDPEITNHVLWPTELKRLFMHPHPDWYLVFARLLSDCGCKGTNKFWITKIFRHFF